MSNTPFCWQRLPRRTLDQFLAQIAIREVLARDGVLSVVTVAAHIGYLRREMRRPTFWEEHSEGVTA